MLVTFGRNLLFLFLMYSSCDVWITLFMHVSLLQNPILLGTKFFAKVFHCEDN